MKQETAAVNPMSAFPGFFNSYTAKKGAFILEIPTFSLDYGVTENFTLGTSALPLVYGAINASPFLYLKARYRFFSNQHFSSAITSYTAGWWNTKSVPIQLGDQGQLLGGTSNTSWHLDKYNIFTFQLGLVRFATSSQSSNATTDRSLLVISPAFGYEHFFSQKFGIEAQVLTPFRVNATEDGLGEKVSINGSFGDWPVAVRVMGNYKTGSSSVLSFGVMAGAFTTSDPPLLPMRVWLKDLTSQPLPVISWSVAL